MAESPDVARRLSELEDRVRVLERRLTPRDVTHGEQAPEPAVHPSPEPLPLSVPEPTVKAPPVIEPPGSPQRIPAPARQPEWFPASRAASPLPKPRKSAFDIERAIGARWFAYIGAVVVVSGVALFFRLAYQQGWLNLIPPAGKCISGAAFGMLLLAAGEVIRRKLGAIASAGASAAGLGALFAASYAAHGVYHLIPPPLAFALLAATAALGFAVAARGRLVSIGVVSLIAAYVNPLLIGDPAAGPLMLPAYLLALLLVGLSLSAWKAVPFRPLRGLAWFGTLIYGGWWCSDMGLNHPGAALIFLGAVWVAVHAELALASRHPALDAPATNLPAELLWNRARFIATSFSSSAWTTVLAVYTLREGAHVADWWPPAVIAVAAAALAIRLAGNLRILRDPPRNDLERLGAGLAMQAGALLVTAIALALSGWLEVVAWLALGIAAVGAGRWIRSRGLDVYGLIALSIAAARLLTFDSPFITPQPWSADLGGIVVTRWAILMALGAGAWVLASRLIRPDVASADGGRTPRSFWRDLGVASLIVGLCHLNLGLIHPRADAGSVCVAWLVLAIAGFLLSRAMRTRAFVAYGVVVLIAASFRFLIDAPLTGAASGVLFEAAGLVITRWTVLMLAGGAAWFCGAAILREERSDPGAFASPSAQLSARAALVGIGLAMVFASMLHPQAHAASVCYAWLVLAALAGVLHSVFRRVALDCYGLAGIAASIIAWFVAYPIDWMSRASLAVHPGLLGSLAIASVAVGLDLWLRSPPNPARPTEPALLRAVIPGVVVLLLISTSLEVARIAGIEASDPAARRAAVSIWWGLVAVGMISAGFWRRAPLARRAGLVLLGAAVVKAMVFDLASVPPIWRVASFVGLGLLMLGVAVGYARVSARLSQPAAPEPP